MENKLIDSFTGTGINSNDSTAIQSYFNFYSKLMNQQNMLHDYVRTSTYFSAIKSNLEDFANKKVLDVGTGSGILAIFSAFAGAEKVYAVEASDAIKYAKVLIDFNNLGDQIALINSKIEDVTDSQIEKVDVILSEPLGVMLINERMLESFLLSRDKFLKKGGKMYPSSATLFFIPFSDESLYKEQLSKISFWDSTNFYGLNMTCLKEVAYREKFRQPIIDLYDPSLHASDNSCSKSFDFTTLKSEELLEFNVNLEFISRKAVIVHGLAVWFDAIFKGSTQEVILSTSPYCSPTHWYQTRLLLLEPLAVNKGQKIIGNIYFKANSLQSYNIYLKLGLPELDIWSENSYDLKDPEFRGFTSNQNK